MYIVDEREREYRFGDSGPKYLMRGPRMNFALMRLNPGQAFPAHYHNEMEENFFVLEGAVEATVDGAKHTLSAGQMLHVEPRETHALLNAGDKPVTLVAALAPYRERDKVDVAEATEG